MICPKCERISVKKGSYRIERTTVAQRRFYCKKCNYHFTERNIGFKKKIPLWKVGQILILNKKQKGYIRKFDASIKKTYSTREISEKIQLSKSYVAKAVKNKT